jgi:LysM repeat protein
LIGSSFALYVKEDGTVQTLKTAFLVVFMLIAVYGAYMIISKPPMKPPEEVSQLTEKDLQAPDIGIGDSVSPDELVFGSAANISNTTESSTDSEAGKDDFDPDNLESSLDINIDGLEEASQPDNLETTPDATDNVEPTANPTPLETTPTNTSAAGNPNPLLTDQPDPLTNPDTNPSLIVPPEQNPDALIDDPSAVNPASVTQPEITTRFASPAERSFEKAWISATKQMAQDHFREALLTLSVFFDDPNLSQLNHTRLLGKLDTLAAHVIYSKLHLLEPAFIVRPGDTMNSIAKQYRVPAALLKNINGIQSESSLLPGTELKVVRGPFRSSISLAKNEMTLFLGHLYAGRFPISIGNNPSPRPGSYQVQLKQSGRPFYNAAKQSIPAGDINNPYGNVWIDLGSNMSIHGTPRVATDANQGHSCIGLGAVDAQDIYGILTEGSQVIIRR